MRRLAGLALLALVLALPAAAAGAGRCPERRPWCDRGLAPERRADLLLRAVTPDERLSLLAGVGNANINARLRGVPRLGLPSVLIADGPLGAARPDDGTSLAQPGRSEALALPAGVALASSFDPRLARDYGALVAREARGRGVDLVLGPALDLVRTPLAGRGFETFGEDPFLAARLGAAWVRGAQAQGVMANAKHFTAYNQETDRFGFNDRTAVDSRVGERTLRELYLPAFEAAVGAGVASVMTAYHRVNGSYMDENAPLLRGVLRRDWGFRGFVLSDFFFGTHGTASSLRAGLDLELPDGNFFRPERVQADLAAGRLAPADVDRAARRILTTLFRFGVLDRAAYRNSGPRPASRARRAAARRFAERGMVLLRNVRRTLPLDARRVRSVAVIGEAASQYELGGGSSAVAPVRSVTPLAGIARRLGPGARLRAVGGEDVGAAVAAARGADAAVIVLADDTSEFEDKTGITLADRNPACDQNTAGLSPCGAAPTPNHDRLVRAVAAANPRTAVVLETGGPVLLPWAGRVGAILEAWYPGQEGGDAIARVLFGDVDPAGRLPQTFPRRASDLAVSSRRQFPGVGLRASYSEGIFVGYRHFDARRIRPQFPFGHGLSYTSFAYEPPSVARFLPRGRVKVATVIRNTGRRAGWAVPQLYVGLPGRRGLPQPPRQLKGMAPVRLRPGQLRRVEFSLTRRDLSSWDARRDRWVQPRGCAFLEVGASSRDIRGRLEIPLGQRRC